MILEYVIDKKIDIKSFLISKGFSLRIINRLLLDKKEIFINEKVYHGNYNLEPNDKLKVNLCESTSVKPIDKKIDIIYEDDFILAVNKPSGLAVIPTFEHFNDNLSSRVLNYFLSKKLDCGLHVLGRLDLPTSGIVIFAKSKHIHSLLSKTEIEKRYRCTVNGILENKSGVIIKPIERIEGTIKRRVSKTGKEGITIYKVISEDGGNSVVDIELKTGRTHQIRVHFSSIGHALIGDKLYGDGEGMFDLCCYFIKFTLPFNNKEYKIEI